MQIGTASCSAALGLARAERSLEEAGSAFTRALGASSAEAAPASLGPSNPLDGLGGGEVGALVQLVAAQRAFSASLAALRADGEMQRAVIDLAR